MPGRTNEQPILTNLTASDFASILRPTSGNNVEAGATDNLVQLSTFLSFIASNMAAINLPGQAFTPQVVGSTSNPTVTTTTAVGRWIKIGALIHVEMRVDWSAFSGGSGALRLRMPAEITVGNHNTFSHLAASAAGITLPTNTASLAARARPGSRDIDFTVTRSEAAAVQLQVSDAGATGQLFAAGTFSA